MKFPQVRSLRAVVFALVLAVILPSEAFAQKVLLLASDENGAEDVQQRLKDIKVNDINLFTQVDLIRVDLPGPAVSLATLLQYDSVMTWSYAPYIAPDELGEVLSQYVDEGHGVVQAAFSLFSDPSFNLGGRWRALSYNAFTPVDGMDGMITVTLVPQQPGHAILAGVNGLAGDNNFWHSGLSVVGSGRLVAEWSNLEPLVATRVAGPAGGRVVGLNLYPVLASDADGVRLMANALLFATTPEPVTNQPPTADAGLDQTLEATGPMGAPFTVTGTVADPDGDTLTIAWTGTGLVGDQPSFSGTLLPPVGVNAVSYTLTLTVSDNNGGLVSDDVVITVRDMTGPVLANVPASTLTATASTLTATASTPTPAVTATATSDAGANVSYGPVTATDAVDGDRPVVCSQSGLFPIGDTLVTCSSSDTRGNSSSASFTVRVTDVTTPGAMVGAGLVRAGGVKYEFDFSVRERGGERGRLQVRVTDVQNHSRNRRDDRFCARTTDFVAFSDDPTVRPGRSRRPQVDTVLFSGMGDWNGRGGYSYEVFAVDEGDFTHRHESVRITIKAPDGSVVANVDGKLTVGFVESARLRR